ncbi:MAG TPA: glycosyltransferase [Candidatus Omnitrophota bacterium]|nr:glycosyltransferase [Candidatus Omnitrophota bacterium]
MKDQHIIYFSSDEWNSGLKTSQYHIAVRLARENKVLYVNSIGLRKPTVSKADFLRIVDKLKRCFRGVQRIDRNLYVFTPIVLPFHGIPWVNAFNRFLLMMFIRYFQIRLGLDKPYIVTFLPNTVDILGRFGERKVIYYCADQVSSFKGVDTAKIEEMEKRLLLQADYIFVTSRQLYEQKKNFSSRVVYLPHGVDTELFNKALKPETEVPSDVSQLREPIIGFFGHVSRDWVDFEIVTFLAQKHPEWSILLIGKVAADIPELSVYKNITLLGSREYTSLPNYSKAFSVAVIPFVDSMLTRNSNPLKLKEYLAAGRPVVSTPIPELLNFSDIIKIASGKEAFLAAVEEYVESDSEENRLKRSKLMERETWDQRFAFFVEIIKR